MSKSKIILCVIGRCSVWGKSWKKHLWTVTHETDPEDGSEPIKTKETSDTCWRCGMTRQEANYE